MGDLSAEPSMEDILSSIKRIIAEEGEGGAAANGRSRQRSTRAAARPEPAEEVLELSDPVRPEPAPAPRPSATARAPEPEPEQIVSPQAAGAAREKLGALSRLIVKPEVAGADTLEGLVREMLRPMLADWLDAHLPAVVERMVAREIERIAHEA